MTLLSDVLAPGFEAEANKLLVEAKDKENTDKEKAKTDEAREKTAAKIGMDIENNAHRESCVKDMVNLHHEQVSSGKFDLAEDLLCFENSVYDLSTCRFRKGVPEDKLSTWYDFVADRGEHRAAMEIYFRRVYSDAADRIYMAWSYAQMLDGRLLKRVFIYAGGNLVRPNLCCTHISFVLDAKWCAAFFGQATPTHLVRHSFLARRARRARRLDREQCWHAIAPISCYFAAIWDTDCPLGCRKVV